MIAGAIVGVVVALLICWAFKVSDEPCERERAGWPCKGSRCECQLKKQEIK